MVSKNNKIVREAKLVPHQEHFTLRKLSIGFVSVLLGVTFMAYNGGDSALAATTDPTADTTSSASDSTAQDNNSTTTTANNSNNAGSATGDRSVSDTTAPTNYNTDQAQSTGLTSSNNSGSKIYENVNGKDYEVTRIASL